MSEENKAVNWRFGVVANIAEYHLGDDGNVYRGTKPFTPGTKVYLAGRDWNRDENNISVIGLNRHGRFALEIIPANCLENVRAQRVFKPAVLEIMHYLEILDGWRWWGITSADRKATKQFAIDWKTWLELSDME